MCLGGLKLPLLPHLVRLLHCLALLLSLHLSFDGKFFSRKPNIISNDIWGGVSNITPPPLSRRSSKIPRGKIFRRQTDSVLYRIALNVVKAIYNWLKSSTDISLSGF
nr:MAG TPA: hypothetical protein [Caudoviricetes sp.]